MNKIDARTVCSSVARHCWNGLHAAGLSADEFSRHTGIAFPELMAAGGRINAEKHRRLTEYMLTRSPGRMLAELDQDAWFADHASLAAVCFNRPTLRDALQRFLALRALIGEFDLMAMRIDDTDVELVYTAEFALGRGGMQACANFKMLAFVVRAYDAGAATVFEVGLEGCAPTFSATMGEFFGAAVRFGQARNAMRFNAVALDRPFHAFNGILAPHLLGTAQQQLHQLRRGQLFSARVEQALEELLNAPVADGASLLQRLCDSVAMTPWSLRRQLQQEQTSFRALEMKVKGAAARRLLRQRALSLGQISDQLGFASQSAFTRFFKAHYQVAPVRYRMDWEADAGAGMGVGLPHIHT